MEIAGQLNAEERRILTAAILDAPTKPQVIIEVGTWLGGGSTAHFLRALQQNGAGHLWGIEADRATYEKMLENIRAAAPEAVHRFTPLFGFSDEVIPKWLAERSDDFSIDVVFLDGGDNPLEQITEFKLLDNRIPVGGRLLAHDAKLRKGRWLVPYLSALDHWSAQLHDVSEEGLFQAQKIRAQPSPDSLRAAEKTLGRLRLNPVEVAGSLLPSAANAFLLRLLPTRLIKRITQGRH
jgi:predicted O-methyltransferase YrrM